MGKWTRRAFISAGVVAGGALLVGVSIRPGKRHQGMAGLVAEDGETLTNAYVKIDVDNHVTAIIPHSAGARRADRAHSDARRRARRRVEQRVLHGSARGGRLRELGTGKG